MCKSISSPTACLLSHGTTQFFGDLRPKAFKNMSLSHDRSLSHKALWSEWVNVHKRGGVIQGGHWYIDEDNVFRDNVGFRFLKLRTRAFEFAIRLIKVYVVMNNSEKLILIDGG